MHAFPTADLHREEREPAELPGILERQNGAKTMKKTTFLATLSIVISLLLSGTAVAGANTTGKVPFAFPVETCVEIVDLEGWVQVVTNEVDDAAGGTRFVIHINAKGTGTGQLTGTRYQWNDAFLHDVDIATAGGTTVFNGITRTILISKGGLPNSSVFFTIHLTITPNGDVVVDRFDFTADCVP